MTFGEALRAERKKQRIKQTEIADAVGISRVMISYYEKEKFAPNVYVAYDIASYLGVSLDYLLRVE